MNPLPEQMSATSVRMHESRPNDGSMDTVVLVHGLAAHKLAMWPLARYLSARGFSVVNWGYPSITRPIEEHARRLTETLESLERNLEASRYHLVTHSMGSIIARTALRQLHRSNVVDGSRNDLVLAKESCQELPISTTSHRDLAEANSSKLQHFVMLGPPNHGSPVARALAPYLGWLCPPLHQLADNAQSYVNCLGLPSCGRWGIVAAERDYVVPLSSTCLTHESDHIVVPGRHTGILFSSRTAREVEHFLRHGRFHPEAKRVCLGSNASFSANELPRPACSSP